MDTNVSDEKSVVSRENFRAIIIEKANQKNRFLTNSKLKF